MRPFLLDPGCAELLTSDAFRPRYFSRVAPARRRVLAAVGVAVPFLSALIVALVGWRLDSPDVLGAAGIVALLGMVPSAIVLFVFLRTSRHVLRLRRLAREGKLVQGRLIACGRRAIETDSDDPDPVVWSVDYEVRAPSGRLLRRTAFRDKQPPGPDPAPGTPVVVLMLDEDLFDML